MSTVAALDDLIDEVADVEKKLDRQASSFLDHTRALQRHTARIKRDITAWQTALTNVHLVESELELAGAAYVLPSSVDALVNAYARGGGKSIAQLSALQVCDAVDAVCHSMTYLESKPPTEIGEQLSEKLTHTMRQVTDVAEKYAVMNVTAVMRQFRHKHTTAGSSGNTSTTTSPTTRAASVSSPKLTTPSRYSSSSHSTTHDFSVISMKAQHHYHRDEAASSSPTAAAQTRNAIRNTQLVVSVLYDALSNRDAAQQIHSLVKETLTGFILDTISGGGGGSGAGSAASAMASVASISSPTQTPSGDRSGGFASIGVGAGVASSAPIFSSMKSSGLYRKGTHPIVVASPAIREMAIDCAIVVAACIVEPMRQDYEVVALAADVCCEACKVCLRQAMRVLSGVEASYDDSEAARRQQQAATGRRNKPPTPKGVVGLHHVEGLCVSLDLLEDFYNWKLVVRKLRTSSSNNNAAATHSNKKEQSEEEATLGAAAAGIPRIEEVDELERCVEDGVEELRSTIGRILSGFLDNLGTVFPADLVEMATSSPLPSSSSSRVFSSASSVSSSASSWLPPADCLVHESTSNFMLMWKLLFSHYAAALRSVLAGLGIELEDFVLEAFEGHLQDLETFGAAAEDLAEQQRSSMVGTKRSSSKCEPGKPWCCVNVPLFRINNCTYVIDVLQNERSWMKQKNEREDFGCTAAAELAPSIIAMCKNKIREASQDYKRAWQDLVPKPRVTGITELYPSDELDRVTRDAVKQWYRDAHTLIVREQHRESSHTTINHDVRHDLQKIAFETVSEIVDDMESALEEREFTTKAAKYPLFADRAKVLSSLFCMY